MGKRILVIGGAGFIGWHMVKMLREAGFPVTVLDNLATGHAGLVPDCDFISGTIERREDVEAALRQSGAAAVMHFAGHSQVGESAQIPELYYRVNAGGMKNILDAMVSVGIFGLIFSSSAAVYGAPEQRYIAEHHPLRPISPYGATKQIAERMAEDYGRAYGINTVALRYFNAAGCGADIALRENHTPETHLIPLVLAEAARIRAGGDPAGTTLKIYGDKADTPDGTCVRDYVHVSDICSAHLLALRRLLAGAVFGLESLNLGTGHGHSVLEVIAGAREVTGMDIRWQNCAARQGDPARLVADPAMAARQLGWVAQHNDLRAIIRSAWRAMPPEK